MSKLAKALTAAAGNAGESLYVEDVFSTYLYEGTGAGIAINNGINLSDEGGLVVYRRRDGAENWSYQDTERGVNSVIYSDSTNAAADPGGYGLASFNSDGFTTELNTSGADYASWSFRKAKKFFDVVTYSSDTTSGARTISHNLGSTPAFIIVKGINFSDAWYVYHISTGVNKYLELNLTGAGHAFTNFWGVTDSTFTVDSFLNNNGLTGKDYVAYLFASDAGGFGDDESIIKCGSYTGNGSADGPTINCGFEPQWLLIKNTSDGGNWVLMDAMRGMPVGDEAAVLIPNTSGDESGYANLWGVDLQATGFKVNVSQIQINESGGTMVYIAIRRPMKTPEAGTEVFAIDTLGGTAPNPPGFNGVLVDWAWKRVRNTTDDWYSQSRLTGTNEMKLNANDAESSVFNILFDYQDGWLDSSGTLSTQLSWMFKRATGFFDVVAYSGSGNFPQNVTHNLTVTPEMMIVKYRDGSSNWYVYHSALGNTKICQLDNDTASSTSGSSWNNTSPTATQFTVGSLLNYPVAGKYIAYLFATLAGVSKVFSVTKSSGSNADVDCGFSAGARFILIKRTDSTGDWYVWDSARGIVAGNDPYLLLNSTAAEVTSTDYIDPLSSGFTIVDGGLANGDYIGLAIA